MSDSQATPPQSDASEEPADPPSPIDDIQIEDLERVVVRFGDTVTNINEMLNLFNKAWAQLLEPMRQEMQLLNAKIEALHADMNDEKEGDDEK